jgi:predicted transcriptional regulator
MTSELVSTVFLSEKRKKILLMLMSGPTTIDRIKESLEGSTSAIMAQVKILLEQGVIEQKGDDYKLTYIGQIVLKKIAPLIKTLDVLEGNKEYWQSRDLSGLPESALDNIGDLGEVLIHEPDLSHLFEPPKQLLQSLKKAENVSTFYSYFCPSCPYNYAELGRKETNFTLILTKSVYTRLVEEYEDQYNAMMGSKKSSLYVVEDDAAKLGALSITDDLLLIAFFNTEGVFDHKKLLSFEESALSWGKELFTYYMEIAEKVK